MITITKAGNQLNVFSFLYPGGEVGVRVDTSNLKYRHTAAPFQRITARMASSNDFMKLAMVTDALLRFDPTPIELFLPYVPYARQDRVCVPGESFSARVFCHLINQMGFDHVIIVDPHSDVTPAMLNRCKVISQLEVVMKFEAIYLNDGQSLLVSPDAGSNKKIAPIAQYYQHFRFLRADKVRDLTTGVIKETVIMGDCNDLNCLIVDDICDGGKTYIELAKALIEHGARHISLFVTHGIFSKGTKVLFESGISRIYSTNSFYDVWPAGVDGVITLDINNLVKLA